MSYNAHYNKKMKYDKLQKYFPFLAYRIFFKGESLFCGVDEFIVKGGEISNTYTHHIFTHFFVCVLGMCFCTHIFGSFVDLLFFTFSFQNLENLKGK